MAKGYEAAKGNDVTGGGEGSHKSLTAAKAAITKASKANPGGRDAVKMKPTTYETNAKLK